MKHRKAVLIALFFWCFAGVIKSYGEEPVISERTVSYKIEYQDVKWYHRLLSFLLGYQLLNWEELDIKETFLDDQENKKIIILNARPKNLDEPEEELEEILYLKNQKGNTDGFVNLLEKSEFTKEEVIKLLSLYNNLYENQEMESDEHIPDLFKNDTGSLHYKIKKVGIENRYLIVITTFNAKGKENSSIKIILNPHPKNVFERIEAEMAIGPKMILIKKLKI